MNRFNSYWLLVIAGFVFMAPAGFAQLEDARGTTASQAVEFLAKQGIVEGYQDGTFKPDQEINRAEFLKLVLEAAGQEIQRCESDTGYEDVNITDWWADIVCTASDLGIIEGYPDGTFRPEQNINLAEGSKIAAKVNELETEVTDSTEAWYQQFIRSLQYNKVIANSLQEVSQNISRGEMAQMVWGLSTGNEVNENQIDRLPQIASCQALNTEIQRFQKRQGGNRQFMRGDVAMPMMMDMEVQADFAQNEAMAESVAAPGVGGAIKSSDGSASRYSETNIQEFGVDEADIIKNDGRYIYLIKGETIRIIEAFPPETMQAVTTLKIEEKGFRPTEMYVDGDTLTVIGQSNQFYAYDEPMPVEPNGGIGSGAEPLPDFIEGDEIEIEDRANEQGGVIDSSTEVASMLAPDMARGYYPGNNKQMTTLVSYDISDRLQPEVIRTVSLEGSYQSSRKIEDTVYLIANKYNDWYWGRPVPLLGNDDLPEMRDSADSSVKMIAPCQEIYYYPNFETANYLTVAAIDTVDTSAEVGRIMMLGSGDNVYSSVDNLYVTRTRYQDRFVSTPNFDGWRNEPTTHIYKFALDGNEIEFTNKGTVRGRVLNQFSMSEADGYFRIATQTDGKDGSMMTILDEDLIQTGQVMGIAPGENIKSVRFMGDKAYMITFLTVDPLFVIDLNPQNPEVLGELKIPGWSDYLHPYDENHLIGIGREVKEDAGDDNRLTRDDLLGLKLAIFDVTDLNNPKEIHKKVIGDNGTKSEATSNHKAFLFDKAENVMALPITVMQQREGGEIYQQDTVFQGAFIYDVSLENGFELRGRASHYNDDYWEATSNERRWGDYEKNVQRILFMDDYWYTVSQNVIGAFAWDTVEKVKQITLDEKACNQIYDGYSCSENSQCRTIWREWDECYTDEEDFSKVCEEQREFSRCEAK